VRKRAKQPSRNSQNESLISVKKKKEKVDRLNLLKRMHGTPNLNLLFLVILLLTGGLLMIFSASAYFAYSDSNIGDTFFYMKKQLQWIALGSIMGYVFYIIPINTLKKISPILLAGGIVLLLYILPEALFGNTVIDGNGDSITSGLQMPFVEALNGAPRWINLQFFNLQPSEYVKFAFVIYISAWLSKEKNNKDKNADKLKTHLQNVVAPFLLLLGAVSILILVQRDFDTTVVLVLCILAVYYVSGTDFIHTIGSITILVSSVIFGGFALMIEGYRRARLETFFHIFKYGPKSSPDIVSEGGYQVFNGLVGIGSGDLGGRGYAESVIKQGYLQEAAYTDSIYAVIGEEFGLLGTVVIIIAFLYFTSIGFEIAKKADNRFSSLLAVGMTSLIAIQAFLNMGAVLVIIPFGGMPLPFFTYGGSSTIITIMAVAVLLNISKNQK